MNRMQSQEFEKKVQQKMEELQISPSAAVWMHVEKEIGQKKGKQKRRVGLLLFFLMLALAVGSTYYVYNRSQSKSIVFTRPPVSASSARATDKLQTQPKS